MGEHRWLSEANFSPQQLHYFIKGMVSLELQWEADRASKAARKTARAAARAEAGPSKKARKKAKRETGDEAARSCHNHAEGTPTGPQ